MGKMKAVVLGSINYDCVARAQRLPKVGETVRGLSFGTFVGGKGANQAVQLALLGADVTFVGKVGEDDVGRTLKESLKSHGIDVRFLKSDATTNSGACSINIDEEGRNTLLYVPGANEKLTPGDVDEAADAIASADILITQNEINLDIVKYGLRLAKRLGVKTLLNPAPALKLPDEVFALVDFIAPNETETEVYCGINPSEGETVLKQAAGWFLDRGVKNVVITLGARGAFYAAPGQVAHAPAFEVKVVDTTAAGDAFIGGFSFTIGQGGTVAQAMRFGCACGSLAASKMGAQVSLPSLQMVKDMLNRQ